MTRTEAGAAFGNPTVYMEKYPEQPRHIEIQVLADEHGNAIYLASATARCSAATRKIIEEAPAPASPTSSARSAKPAPPACKIGYRGVGTFEFPLETANSSLSR